MLEKPLCLVETCSVDVGVAAMLPFAHYANRRPWLRAARRNLGLMKYGATDFYLEYMKCEEGLMTTEGAIVIYSPEGQRFRILLSGKEEDAEKVRKGICFAAMMELLADIETDKQFMNMTLIEVFSNVSTDDCAFADRMRRVETAGNNLLAKLS